jgi:hypothetical protein
MRLLAFKLASPTAFSNSRIAEGIFIQLDILQNNVDKFLFRLKSNENKGVFRRRPLSISALNSSVKR